MSRHHPYYSRKWKRKHAGAKIYGYRGCTAWQAPNRHITIQQGKVTVYTTGCTEPVTRQTLKMLVDMYLDLTGRYQV